MNYLIDTNVFFDVLRQGEGSTEDSFEFGLKEAQKGECYISYITQIEIISVIGKYARGGTNDWQQCKRQIELEDGNFGMCSNRCRVEAPRKKWPSKRIGALRKLLKDILAGESDVLSVKVLDINKNVLQEASSFIERAVRFRFGSLDAIIAGTAKSYKDLDLYVVTKDKGFRAALFVTGIPLYKEDNKETINGMA
ncbi:MAG: type II toxin-antitoxin system VapC family toxin [Selenomonas ruminantium]|jgi:predicted nucleic acid-binding protein|uniref:Type II toxin-antitoxin system VapC family toxin n=1 Tax=Selenomonas ruminantium TaxID=971 RepID=A0A927WNG9_SELRU|nr:PIN domain-containing protein [Selenomonas ruminantium]MBE6085510.1 type II toxin-antitoxin system VapC family toxin [Selenomonas ruminantium]